MASELKVAKSKAAEAAQNSSELLLLKFLPSTYTFTAISWPFPLISQLFFTLAILNRTAPFFTAGLQPGCF